MAPGHQPPRQRLARAQRLELGLAENEAVGRRPASRRSVICPVARQAVEGRAVEAGKALQPSSAPALSKAPGVHLDGGVRGVAAGAARGVFLQVRGVGALSVPRKNLALPLVAAATNAWRVGLCALSTGRQ